MRKKCSLLMLFLSFLLCGCEIEIVTPSSSDLSSNQSSNSGNTSSNGTSSIGLTSSSATLIEPTSSFSSSFDTSLNSSFVEQDYKKMLLDGNALMSKVNSIIQYSTGNYGVLSCGNIDFEFYRAYRSIDNGDIGTLFTSTSDYMDYALPGAFYNINPIYDIRRIKIEYYMNEGENNSAYLRFGGDKLTTSSVGLPYSETLTSFVFDTNRTNYFKIETNGADLTIGNIILYYSNNDYGWGTADYLGSGNGAYRLNPVRYSGTLISGESSVNIPMAIEANDKNYEVTSWKTYTYYSYDDVVQNISLAASASYVDPIDVANYFIAFGEYPANYVSKSKYNSAEQYFGDKTRCVSSYSRTDGYATAVPYAVNDGSLLYYECDIALDSSYSGSNRGVGRVVVWIYGFRSQGYDASPVAVYTDDHYATFREYYNNGEFGVAFNAERLRGNYTWSSPTILN